MAPAGKVSGFYREGNDWLCNAGLPSDLTITVEGDNFHLHKFPLVSKCGKIARILEESQSIHLKTSTTALEEFPGGPDTFLIAVKFCYGIRVELTPQNIVTVYCASDYLEMTDEYGEDNLLSRAEGFFHKHVLRNWKDCILALQSSEMILLRAEKLHIISKCLSSLSMMVCTDPSLFGWPMMMYGSLQSPGGSILWNGINTGARIHSAESDWWFEDISYLSVGMFERLIEKMEERGIRPENLSGAIMYYSRKYLPGLSRWQSVPSGKNRTVASFSLTPAAIDQRFLLETIVKLIPEKKGKSFCRFLLGLLRVALILGGLTPYEKKKYVWKMLYIYMLGYDVDFGHMEAVSLISAPKYPEKQVGYIVTSSLLNENHDFLRLAINTVRNDIIGRNETFQCLALTMVGNIGGREFAESLAPDVQKLLISSSCRPLVRKKAALCLLRLFRKNPDVVNVDGWADRMAQLLDERDLGVLTSSMSLLVALVSNNHEAYWSCLPKCVKILERLARNQDVPQEYTYYGIPSPWLQVKTMRALQYFPTIEDPNTRKSLFEVLQRILMGTDVVKNVNKNNASHAVLFEALALVMHLDAEKEMMSQCVALLGKFIAVREPNIRYLGLENMTRMLMVTDVQDIIKRHQAQIITSLKDPDVSIRRRALDLLYGMCDVSNAKDIVEELLQYLNTADFAMREELSLKAAILAEKFAPDLSWYVDVILQLIDKAGDFVSDDIWFRVVQFVTNNEDLQPYAAAKARDYLDKPAIHETMVKVSAHLLGEFGHLLARRPGCSPKELFSILHEKLPTVSTFTIPILLSTYAKILMHTQPPDPELQNQIWAIFNKYESCIDAEIQQRAVEYFALSRKGAALMDILAEMPKFPERQSALIKRAEDTEVDTADQSAIKLRAQQQQMSNALVVTDQRPVNGTPPVGQLSLVKVPSMSSNMDNSSADQALAQPNGLLNNVDQPPSADLLGDLLGQLAIEGPPGAAVQFDDHAVSGLEGTPNAVDGAAIVPVGEQTNSVQPIGNINERFQALCLKDSGILYEDPFIQIGIKAEWQAHQGRIVLFLGNKNTSPLVCVQALVLPPSHLNMELSLVPETIPPRAQVQCPLEVVNLRPSRDVAVLDFSYKFGTNMVNAKLRLPAILNKFLQPISVLGEEFFLQWRSLSGPPLKLQEVVRGVRPMPLLEMTNLFNSLRLMVCPGLDPNPNNLVASTTFYSESTKAMLCLVRNIVLFLAVRLDMTNSYCHKI
ncbi:Alpha-adaptin isoform 5 [Tripterygium wilfordii]|uniref:Alpha-adaptin isoform 5 n=1 Tax=Tripterygium wilfordii TaxID=458696 RepID=A0A7J7DFG5_TRIWF|nr:Alpha-adaptin isoform 5 [Tripterygium wilfordii]